MAVAPPRGLSLTFDDGNASDLELALPVLQANGLSARFFILAGRIGQPGFLDADGVRALHRAGMQIGSHGLDHRDWRRLDDRELRAETSESRNALSELIAAEVTEASCPFGLYDRRVLRALRGAGYERVFTSDGSTGRAGSRVMPRVSISTDQPLEEWIALAAESTNAATPSLLTRAKRLSKRLR